MSNHPIRVLIADDEKISRESMRDYLPWSDMGMETPVCVENGALALDCLCHADFDLFIMDIRMPVMDGMALLAEIAHHDIDVTIIVLSAYDQFDYAQKAIQSRKVFEYVLKPIRRSAFCEILQKAAAEALQHREHRSDVLLNPDLDAFRREYLACLHHNRLDDGLTALHKQVLHWLQQPEALSTVRRFLIALYTDTRLAALQSQKDLAALPEDRLADISACDDAESLWSCFHRATDELHPYLNTVGESSRSKAGAVVEHCLDEIRLHYTEKDFSLNRLADEMQLNPNYLSTRFKKEVGIGFVRYVNRLRVRQAQELLRDMRYRTNEVADLVGFENPRYFTRIFKEMTGVVPSEYRSRLHRHTTDTSPHPVGKESSS